MSDGCAARPLMNVLLPLVICVLLAAALVVAANPVTTDAEAAEGLPEHWQIWLDEEVYPLISKEQRAAFLALESEAQRQAYAERLWDLWRAQSGLGKDFRQVYAQRVQYCRDELGSTTGERARVVLLHGQPDDIHRSRCNRVFVPLELWYWQYLDVMGKDVVVLFYQPNGVGPYRLWNPYETRRVLYRYSAWLQKLRASSPIDEPEHLCFDSDTLMTLIDLAEHWGPSTSTLAAGIHRPASEEPDTESPEGRLPEFSTLLPADAEPLELAISQVPQALQGGKVGMGFTVTVASEGLGRAEVGGAMVVQLDLVGEISRDDSMVDRFRYVFTVPDAPEQLSLLFERFLRPGDYTLRIKLEDMHSLRAGVSETGFTVQPPTPEELAAAPAPVSQP